GAVGGSKDTPPLGNLDTIALEAGTVDFAERRLGIGRVTVTGGGLHVLREKDGSFPLLKILAPSDEGLLRREIGGLAKEAKAEGKPWRVALDELAVNDTQIAVTDLSFGE